MEKQDERRLGFGGARREQTVMWERRQAQRGEEELSAAEEACRWQPS